MNLTHKFSNPQDACYSIGVQCPANLRRTGDWQLCRAVGHRGSNRAGRIRFFNEGNGGIVYNWYTGEKAVWFDNYNANMTKQEKKVYAQKVQAELAKQRQEQEAKYNAIADKAKYILNNMLNFAYVDSSFSNDNGYFRMKHLSDFVAHSNLNLSVLRLGYVQNYLNHKICFGGDFLNENTACLCFPLCDAQTGEVSTLQFISPNGKKAMLAGGQLKGKCWFPVQPNDNALKFGTIGVAEGIATALSVYLLTGHYCVSAMCCANLAPVTQALHKRYPNARIIVYGDKGNGEQDAYKASALIKGRCFIPSYTDNELMAFYKATGKDNPTDFNDLLIARSYIEGGQDSVF